MLEAHGKREAFLNYMKPLDYLFLILVLPFAAVLWLVAAAMMTVAFVYDLLFSRR